MTPTIDSILSTPELEESREFMGIANSIALIPELSKKYIEAAVAAAFLQGQHVVTAKRDTRYEAALDEIDNIKKFSMPPSFNLDIDMLRTEFLPSGLMGVRLACGDPINCGCDKEPVFTLNAEDVIPFAGLLLTSLQTNVVDPAVNDIIETTTV